MAIFEDPIVRKVSIDDTEPLTCIIENWRIVNGHAEFVIKVHRGPFADKSWHISKRYNDFLKLHNYFKKSGINNLQLPPKKLVGNLDSEFLTERLQSLQKYLNSILMNPILISSLPARSFIDPANYCQPFGEIALQHVSLALRGELGWEVVCPLEEIGWRLRKHFYQIRCKSLPKEELIGSWTDFGPDKYLSDKDLHVLFKCLNQIQHPYIQNVELCICTDIGGLGVRMYNKNGSLRDLLYGVKPRQSFLKKYGSPKGHKPLEMSQVALYGRQILEALKFLMEKGIPYGHLHTGNVLIENNTVKLLEIENGILGVPSFYRPYFMQHRKINTMEAINVYCFGHTLYEMTFGTPLQESVADSMPSCPQILRTLLESILCYDAFKSGLPTIEHLLKNPFFSSVDLKNDGEKIHLKIPSSIREHLKNNIAQMEERLKEEQKMIRSQKRLVRVQEMMSSEEEKKKHKQKLKQEQKNIAKEQQKQKSKEIQSKLNSSIDRPDSVSSNTTASVESATLPSGTNDAASNGPPAPPPPPLSVLPDSSSSQLQVNNDRSALLGAICNFNKTTLRKTKVK